MTYPDNPNNPNNINYPPDELLHPRYGKRDYILIILWLLENNEVCTWSELSRDINKSTLSIYLNRLKAKNFIEKSQYNQYQITLAGKEEFYELSSNKIMDGNKLNFPPQIMLNRHIYDDIILWMVYNNNSCRWADLIDRPLAINQSSLSKAIRRLLDKQFIEKNDKRYQITFLGKEEYADILRNYNLDLRYKLKEESRRIARLTKKALAFLIQFQCQIVDSEVKFRFLRNLLILPYDRVEQQLDQEDFWKILLFLAINHPGNHAALISAEAFAQEYEIDKVILDFHVLQIVKKQIYPTKFFQLSLSLFGDKIAYFQENEKLGKILSAAVEEHFTQFAYLNKLHEDLEEASPLTLEATTERILTDICGPTSVFDPVFESSLRLFLPDYVDKVDFLNGIYELFL
ncbi:MAG: hypothetical protein ACTSWW_05080 [Promethearchaeota archaeon]